MSEDGETVVLKKFKPSHVRPTYATPEWVAENQDAFRTGVAVDVETTGLNKATDRIIEVGLRTFTFNRNSGEVIDWGAGVSQLQDPGISLPHKIKSLTGLDDAVLKGHQIDWKQIDTILSAADIIIAHNASFDRPFIEKHSVVSPNKIWGCSIKQVDWEANGFPMSKLEVLCYHHGFFSDSHRALNDADVLVRLLSLPDGRTKAPYLNELLINARRPIVLMNATYSPFESKDLLRDRGYGWEPSQKCWRKAVFKEQLADELGWLEHSVYKGTFRGNYQDLPNVDNFKE